MNRKFSFRILFNNLIFVFTIAVTGFLITKIWVPNFFDNVVIGKLFGTYCLVLIAIRILSQLYDCNDEIAGKLYSSGGVQNASGVMVPSQAEKSSTVSESEKPWTKQK